MQKAFESLGAALKENVIRRAKREKGQEKKEKTRNSAMIVRARRCWNAHAYGNTPKLKIAIRVRAKVRAYRELLHAKWASWRGVTHIGLFRK